MLERIRIFCKSSLFFALLAFFTRYIMKLKDSYEAGVEDHRRRRSHLTQWLWETSLIISLGKITDS